MNDAGIGAVESSGCAVEDYIELIVIVILALVTNESVARNAGLAKGADVGTGEAR